MAKSRKGGTRTDLLKYSKAVSERRRSNSNSSRPTSNRRKSSLSSIVLTNRRTVRDIASFLHQNPIQEIMDVLAKLRTKVEDFDDLTYNDKRSCLASLDELQTIENVEYINSINISVVLPGPRDPPRNNTFHDITRPFMAILYVSLMSNFYFCRAQLSGYNKWADRNFIYSLFYRDIPLTPVESPNRIPPLELNRITLERNNPNMPPIFPIIINRGTVLRTLKQFVDCPYDRYVDRYLKPFLGPVRTYLNTLASLAETKAMSFRAFSDAY